jgi:glycosyltransferase involved in cell wall biosynthesis
MVKIVVLGSHADSLLKFRREMLASMAKNNEVVACAPNANSAIIAEMHKIGVQYCNVSLARTGLNPIFDLKTLYTLYQLFKQLKPDVLFAYTSKPVIFGTIAARLAGVKKCYSMITGLGTYFIYNDFKSQTIRLIMAMLYKIALSLNTKVFFQNPDDRNVFAKLKIFNDPEKTVMINGSGVNLDHFKVQEMPKNIPTFVLISRLIRDKGILEYLHAAQMLHAKYPQVKCLLVGWFDSKQQALNIADIQPYINRGEITYLGALDDVRPALAQAAIFVLPSYREGTPKGVLEAMAMGRAIITTDAPGCRETVINGDNGYLVATQDPIALFHAMEQFVLDPNKAITMGQRSRVLAEAKYNVHSINKTLLAAMGLQYA